MIEPASNGAVKTHSEKNTGSFFETILKKGKIFFAED
jgi:hypothetical protein